MMEYVDLSQMVVPFPSVRKKAEYRILMEQLHPGKSIAIPSHMAATQTVRQWAVRIGRWRGVNLSVHAGQFESIVTCSLPDDGRMPVSSRLARVVRLGLEEALKFEDGMEF